MKFEIDKKDLEILEEKISKLGDAAEKETNSIIHDFGIKTLTNSVTNKLPVSSRSKKHAKFSKPFTTTKFNLGFDFKTKKKFNYLIFPDEGRGPRNKIAQNFTEAGSKLAKPIIMKELLEQITNKLQEGI